MSVLSARGGTQDFGLQEMKCVYETCEGNKHFVPWMNHRSITCRFDMFERDRLALVGSDNGGWRLCDELPDTDVDRGMALSEEKFNDASRWQGDTRLVLKHLFKKHEGELVEVVGKWVEGRSTPAFSCTSIGISCGLLLARGHMRGRALGGSRQCWTVAAGWR